jgi:hypothetical protein
VVSMVKQYKQGELYVGSDDRGMRYLLVLKDTERNNAVVHVVFIDNFIKECLPRDFMDDVYERAG